MSSFPSFIQNISDPLRRLRVRKLWLVAQELAGVETDVSGQIESIEEQIGRILERARLIEEFWKIENKDGKDLGGLDVTSDPPKVNRFEPVTSPQIAHGMTFEKDKKTVR